MASGKKTTITPIQSAIIGGAGNAISRTVIAPLERLRMQMIADPGKHSSMWGCISGIYQKEGIRGLWAGNSVNVLRIAPQGAIAFGTKDYFKEFFAGKGNKPTPLQTLLASMVSGIFCQTCVYPLDTVRTRITASPQEYKGINDAFRTIAAKEGPRAYFVGLVSANCFAVPYYGTQLFTYDMLKETYLTYGMPEGLQRVMSPVAALPLGAIAGMTSCTVAFPFQTAWKRMQVQGIGDRPIKYRNMLDVWVQIVKHEGVKGMYAGWPANLIKLAPTGAITFLAVEMMKELCGFSLGN